MTAEPVPGAWRTFWRAVVKVDHSKINPWIALRNSLAVAIPLAVGIAIHQPLGGVAVCTGALNVSFSDGTDPYKQRARRMFLWTWLGAVAVFLGSYSGSFGWVSVLVTAIWAFAAGLCLALGTRIGDLGLNTLVSIIVFAARGAMDLEGAVKAAALVVAGGLLQMSFALLFWPIRRSDPERRVVAALYVKLAEELDPASNDTFQNYLSKPDQQVQDLVDALGRDHSTQSERYRMLVDQIDRLRLSTFAVRRLRIELRYRKPEDPAPAATRIGQHIDQILTTSASLVQSIGRCLQAGGCASDRGALTHDLNRLSELSKSLASCASETPLLPAFQEAVQILAGQLRVVVSLAAHTAADGEEAFATEEAALPWRLRFRNSLGTLRANLNPQSAYFRHAVRLAICVAAGDMMGRLVWWQRTYWLPMTIAVVLKPDFTTTYSRGILRLGGTFLGLIIATALYHLLPNDSPGAVALGQLVLVGLFTFALRCIGPANYGVFSASVGALIVFLVAATGVPPKDVVLQRAWNTAAGGIFALIAYAFWPTWERSQAFSVMADMLDAARAYFQQVSEALLSREFGRNRAMDETRLQWTLARSNAEASVDRLSSEPRTTRALQSELTSLLASSHGFVYAVMGLEAYLLQKRSSVPEAFAQFGCDVEFTLYFLSSALRGSHPEASSLPKLRDDHRKMTESLGRLSSSDRVFLAEADRITVSLNTLREHIVRMTAPGVDA